MADDERRVPKRVPIPATACRVEARGRSSGAAVVNLSPEGACLAVGRTGGHASDELTNAWVAGLPLRVVLDGDAATATGSVRWARGPRPGEPCMLFGIRFDDPLEDFGRVVRGLVGH